MGFVELGAGRVFVARAEYDSDLLVSVTELTEKNGISKATFTVIGALKNARLGFYDQKGQVYLETLLQGPQEIASCTGNVSLKNGTPFVHAHATLADEKGDTKGGHLLGGTVFAAEICLTELVGAELVRKTDVVTGLSLWDL